MGKRTFNQEGRKERPSKNDVLLSFSLQDLLFNNIYRALELGHVDTAQFLMRLSRQQSATTSPVQGATHSPPAASSHTHGLTELHELVLYSEDALPPAFRVSELLHTLEVVVVVLFLPPLRCGSCTVRSFFRGYSSKTTRITFLLIQFRILEYNFC